MSSTARLILEISDANLREAALAQLSSLSEQNEEVFHSLGPLIWHSFGTTAVLVGEVISVYPLLSPPTLTLAQSERVCNAVLLLKCVAAHSDTRTLFLNSFIPLYLFPFIETTNVEDQFESLRCCSLGVIGCLVTTSESLVVSKLLEFDLLPKVLLAMDLGTGLSKTLATYILERILVSEAGLPYVCTSDDKMSAVVMTLRNMVAAIAEEPSAECLEFTVTCYLRLSQTEQGLNYLRYHLPMRLYRTLHRHISFDVSLCLLALQKNVHRSQLQHHGQVFYD